jgi:NAD(P)-dependent dehydrogenase (short-subunit alcohol dehydrogenase family)
MAKIPTSDDCVWRVSLAASFAAGKLVNILIVIATTIVSQTSCLDTLCSKPTLAITTELASFGATVVIASRDRTKCEQAAKELNDTLPRGPRVFAGPSTSIRKEGDIQNLVAFVVKEHGSLDLLVNNAGGQFISPAEDMSSRGFSAVVETDLTGTFLVCREAYTQYMKDHGGSIVNITLGNRNGMPYMVHSGGKSQVEPPFAMN